jgi:hypothetical protein
MSHPQTDKESQLKTLTEEHAARRTLYSSLHGAALADAKARALHEFRDQEWRARLDLAQLRASEGYWHHLWRLLGRKPVPTLTAARDSEPFLNRWREPVTRHSQQPTDAVTPIDRTRRTTADALAKLPDLPLT